MGRVLRQSIAATRRCCRLAGDARPFKEGICTNCRDALQRCGQVVAKTQAVGRGILRSTDPVRVHGWGLATAAAEQRAGLTSTT
jgi:hypothetical protein